MAIKYYETRGPSIGTVQDTDPTVTPPETILVDMGPTLGLQRVAVIGDAQFYQADNGPTLGLGRVAIGGGGYNAKAVHFDGNTWFTIDSLNAADSAFLSVFTWAKFAVNGNVFNFDPNNNYAPLFKLDDFDGGVLNSYPLVGNGNINVRGAAPTGAWHSMCFVIDTNHNAGAKIAKFYVDRVDVTNLQDDSGNAFLNGFNAVQFVLGGDGFSGGVFDLAETRLMRTSILTAGDIAPATLDLFLTAGNKPVDPAVATTALGAPMILCSGDATTFGVNQGSGGAFVPTGALTNATTSPSD